MLFIPSCVIHTDDYSVFALLNDVWQFEPVTQRWAWLSGSIELDSTGVYGQQGVSNQRNTPGARYTHALAIDRDAATLILFGGRGYDAANIGKHEIKTVILLKLMLVTL